ncbi:hypothetical protein RRG08_022976 [Elysia crispata]|uniref:Uncharacterized protein n=1 Tax=Elysia crispata TaxID=231223 RepID=A0AAE1AEJ1_9GAST|nr:hypothetical protein RRG08_022976 [Elysia crispata]
MDVDWKPQRLVKPVKLKFKTAEADSRADRDINQNRKSRQLAFNDSPTSGSSNYSSSSSSHRSRAEASLPLSYDPQGQDLLEGFGYNFRTYLSGKKWIDSALFAWHSIVLVTALFAFLFATFILFSFPSYIIYHLRGLPGYSTYRKVIQDPKPYYNFHFYSQVNILCSFFIVVNMLYIASAVVYMTYFTHRNALTLPALTLVTSVLFIMEGAFVNVLFNPDILRDDDNVRSLQEKLQREYRVSNKDEFSVTQDHISIWLKCCGIVDSFDFFNVSLQLQNSVSLQVPPSCCKRRVFEEGIAAVESCIRRGDEDSIYRDGCMDAYMEWIQTLCHAYVIYTWIHLIDCVIHAALYRNRLNFIEQVISATSEGPSEAVTPLELRGGIQLDQLKRPSVRHLSRESSAKEVTDYGRDHCGVKVDSPTGNVAV